MERVRNFFSIVAAILAIIASVATGLFVFLSLQFRVQSLEQNRIISLSVPPGGIVAFEEKCPPGWQDIGRSEPEKFSGRVLVAAGPKTLETSSRNEGEAGGKEMYKLRQETREGARSATTHADAIFLDGKPLSKQDVDLVVMQPFVVVAMCRMPVETGPREL